MKKRLLAVLLLAGSCSIFAAPRFYFGVGVGGHYGSRVYVGPPPVYRYHTVVRPVYPGPNYEWIDGYYYPVGGRYLYREGYWGRRPYVGARWVAPRYNSHYYYHGYWRR